MSSSLEEIDSHTGTDDEQSPLLGSAKPVDNGTIERGADGTEDRDSNHETLIAEEPSTGELLVVLIGIWFGCFLAALDSTVSGILTHCLAYIY